MACSTVLQATTLPSPTAARVVPPRNARHSRVSWLARLRQSHLDLIDIVDGLIELHCRFRRLRLRTLGHSFSDRDCAMHEQAVDPPRRGQFQGNTRQAL